MINFWNCILESIERHITHFRQLALMMTIFAIFMFVGMITIFNIDPWLSFAAILVLFTFSYGMAFGIMTLLFAMRDVVEGRWD